MRRPPLSALLPEIYRRLYAAYGPQGWWPAESAFEVIVGAILTQSTAWVNVERALAALREAGVWSFEAIAAMPPSELAAIIRSSGYYNAKARKLQAFATHALARGGLAPLLAQEMAALRAELLSIHGIGEETADDIIVYAAGKPSFVIDSYTRRIVDRMGFAPPGRNPGYGAYQSLFHRSLPADAALFNEFHALLDHHAKIACRKTQPICASCALADLCTSANDSEGAASNIGGETVGESGGAASTPPGNRLS